MHPSRAGCLTAVLCDGKLTAIERSAVSSSLSPDRYYGPPHCCATTRRRSRGTEGAEGRSTAYISGRPGPRSGEHRCVVVGGVAERRPTSQPGLCRAGAGRRARQCARPRGTALGTAACELRSIPRERCRQAKEAPAWQRLAAVRSCDRTWLPGRFRPGDATRPCVVLASEATRHGCSRRYPLSNTVTD